MSVSSHIPASHISFLLLLFLCFQKDHLIVQQAASSVPWCSDFCSGTSSVEVCPLVFVQWGLSHFSDYLNEFDSSLT